MADCFALAIDDDDSCDLQLFATEEARDAFLWDYAFEKRGDDETLDEFKARFDGEVSDAMELCHCGWHTDDMVQKVPVDPVQAARAAVEALAYARDCFKVAGAQRKSIDRVRLALSSAKGLVRMAESRQRRKEEGRT